MRVAIFVSYSDYVPILFVESEIIDKHLRQGDRVTVIRCGRALETCHGLNRLPGRTGVHCFFCQSRFQGAIGSRDREHVEVLSLWRDSRAEHADIPIFNTMAELKSFTYAGVDVGLGAASSLISAIHDVDPDMRPLQERARIYVRTAINSFLVFSDYFQRARPDLFYLFNGRFAEARPALRAAQREGIAFRTYEIAPRPGYYHVYDNAMPHWLSLYAPTVAAFWESCPDKEEARSVVDHWFTEAAGQRASLGVQFRRDQVGGSLPPHFDSNLHNIAIFNSSEDETGSIEESIKLNFFPDQENAVAAICAELSDRKDIHFYLRVHPRLGRVPNAQLDKIRALRAANLTVLEPNDPVDSYALAMACDKVLSFGSTIGAEAAYLGRPSILCASTFYSGLECNYEPTSKEGLFALLRQRDLPPLSKEGAYKFFYWLLQSGEPFAALPNPVLEEQIYIENAWGYDRLGRVYRKLLDWRMPVDRLKINRMLEWYQYRGLVREWEQASKLREPHKAALS